MTTSRQYEALQDARAKLLDEVLGLLGAEALADPNLPDIVNQVADRELGVSKILAADGTSAPMGPGDDGFADLVGLGSSAAGDIGHTNVTPGVIDYDDTLKSERILGAADLYYLYLHEAVGAFRVVWKLQELFRAGSLRISSGPGAFALYRFDKHSVLRYNTRERFTAYRRVLGYTNASPGPNARANTEFHPLFVHFIGETAKYWRDKRISEVIRRQAADPSFGSIAIVRRAGLDLRNNLKNSSYGWVSVLRIETLQALAEAFRILSAEDVRAQFGAETAWDTIELVSWQYFGKAISASAMNRMAVSGRSIIQWLAEPYVLKDDRRQFEAALQQIAEPAEEWLSSHEGLRLSKPTPPPRHVYRQGPPPAAATPPRRRTVRRRPLRLRARPLF
jgi:hypothetical protein